MSPKPNRTGSIVSVQTPDELRAKLQDRATAANRSLSAEILRRLERSFSVEALQEDAVALAVESALGEYTKRMTEQMNASLAQIEQLKAEQTQRLAKELRALEEITKRSRK